MSIVIDKENEKERLLNLEKDYPFEQLNLELLIIVFDTKKEDFILLMKLPLEGLIMRSSNTKWLS